LVDAASVGAGLWFSYLFVMIYFLIAVGGVTHPDLFLKNPVRLPFFNVDLPLLGFFVLGPAIFLIVHAYVLLHFVLLAGKVGDFDTELKAQIADEEVRRRLRRQLPSNIFVQFLAGSREVRTGVLGFLLRLIAQVSLVIGPVALLVFFELQFLPYHGWSITWWHRIAVLADMLKKADFTAAQLQGAYLVESDLRGAKFDCADSQQCVQLQDALVGLAQLQGASLVGARLQGASLLMAQLQGASLDDAHLQCALLRGAELQGASLSRAQLQGALLTGEFQGASLDGARIARICVCLESRRSKGRLEEHNTRRQRPNRARKMVSRLVQGPQTLPPLRKSTRSASPKFGARQAALPKGRLTCFADSSGS
jgi:Pentapeptide repeats (8 copies)